MLDSEQSAQGGGSPAGDAAVSVELVTRFVAGDRDAFLSIFDRLKHAVWGQVRRFFLRPFDQEEAFQEAWLQIYRMRGKVDVNRHAELEAWIRKVARNRCLDLLRRRNRQRDVPDDELEPTQEATQQHQLRDRRLRQAVGEFVKELPDEEQRHFELCFVQELPHQQIGEQLSISARRSKYLKRKMLQRMLRSPALRRAYDEPGDDKR